MIGFGVGVFIALVCLGFALVSIRDTPRVNAWCALAWCALAFAAWSIPV